MNLKPTPRRPVVLITADVDDAPSPLVEPKYRLRANYAAAVAEAGGLALILPCELDQLDAALTLADGILISGSEPGIDVSEHRSAFERELILRALAAGKPLLGICHGMQLIGECLGGRVIRDDRRLLADVTPHIPSPVPNVPAHGIVVEHGSGLWTLHPSAPAQVNSLHRHALAEGGQEGGRYRVVARADDGVVEAIEGLGESFCLGVQWHPEYRLTELDKCILSAFVQRCSQQVGS